MRSELRLNNRPGLAPAPVVAETGENIEHLALARLRVGHAIRGKQRQFQLPRDCDGGLIARFFFAEKWRWSST